MELEKKEYNMEKETRTFTEEEISHIQCYGGFGDTEDSETETGYSVVAEEVVDTDMEKNSIDIEYVLEEHSTGKFFRGVLGKSPWNRQDEYNAKVVWKEVERTERTIYYYV
tara:strand:- start:13326 stop:13658 length:333 start_codon:yes stop_codon:yes gene_type:complete